MFSGGAKQGGSCSVAACFRNDEQVVQDKNPRQAAGREARIKLGETGDNRAFGRQKDDGLVVLKTIQQKLSSALRITELAVKLTVRVKQRHEQIQI